MCVYLLFVTSPNPAPLRSLSPFCSFSLSLFFPVRALVCTYVCLHVYVCIYGCVSASFIVFFCECVLCNFHVVVFLRQLFGAPFFKTNHKHHEADDDDNLLFVCLRAFSSSFLFLSSSFIATRFESYLFLFCYCFLPQLFGRRNW